MRVKWDEGEKNDGTCVTINTSSNGNGQLQWGQEALQARVRMWNVFPVSKDCQTHDMPSLVNNLVVKASTNLAPAASRIWKPAEWSTQTREPSTTA